MSGTVIGSRDIVENNLDFLGCVALRVLSSQLIKCRSCVRTKGESMWESVLWMLVTTRVHTQVLSYTYMGTIIS